MMKKKEEPKSNGGYIREKVNNYNFKKLLYIYIFPTPLLEQDTTLGQF